MTAYPEILELDGVYFRVFRDGEWTSLCFTDLTKEEQSSALDSMDSNQLKWMAQIMASNVRDYGEMIERVERILYD